MDGHVNDQVNGRTPFAQDMSHLRCEHRGKGAEAVVLVAADNLTDAALIRPNGTRSANTGQLGYGIRVKARRKRTPAWLTDEVAFPSAENAARRKKQPERRVGKVAKSHLKGGGERFGWKGGSIGVQ